MQFTVEYMDNFFIQLINTTVESPFKVTFKISSTIIYNLS